MIKKIYLKALLIYMAVFFAVITYMEVAVRVIMDGKIQGRNLTFLLFVPALSLFFSLLSV